MRSINVLRLSGLALVLGLALPAPAAPQLGKFIKKAIKQKMADKVEQTIVGSDTTAPAAGTPGGAAPGRAKKGTPVGSGPAFSEYVLEITPALLDQLEKGLAAEAVDRKAAMAEAAKILPAEEYRKCEQSVNGSPAAQKVYQEYAANPGTDQQSRMRAGETYRKGIEALMLPKCGPGGNAAITAKYELKVRPEKAGQTASGLTQYQYAILKERVLPFCASAAASAATPAGPETRIAAEGSTSIYYVYAPGEIDALRPRCAKLVSALQQPQPDPGAVGAAKKQKR